MKPETRFCHWLLEHAPTGHFCGIEPPPSPGVPDLNYCIESVEGWLELKVRSDHKCPFKRRPLLRPAQRRWFKTRIRVGGRCAVCVLIGVRLHFIRGENIFLVTERTTKKEFEALCYCAFNRVDVNIPDLLLAALTD